MTVLERRGEKESGIAAQGGPGFLCIPPVLRAMMRRMA